jgi:hypothetical protein
LTTAERQLQASTAEKIHEYRRSKQPKTKMKKIKNSITKNIRIINKSFKY